MEKDDETLLVLVEAERPAVATGLVLPQPTPLTGPQRKCARRLIQHRPWPPGLVVGPLKEAVISSFGMCWGTAPPLTARSIKERLWRGSFGDLERGAMAAGFRAPATQGDGAGHAPQTIHRNRANASSTAGKTMMKCVVGGCRAYPNHSGPKHPGYLIRWSYFGYYEASIRGFWTKIHVVGFYD